MNKNVLIATVVLILIMLGAGGYFLATRSRTTTPPPLQTTQSAGNSQSGVTTMQKASLKSLMNTSNNQNCTFSDTATGSSGTMYIGTGKSRGDFSSQIQGTTTASHMISDGEYVYMWMEGQTTGFKVSVASMETMQNQAAAQGNAQIDMSKMVDINKDVDYECSNWSVDNSVFVVPSTITFTDYSAMMKDAGEMMKKISTIPEAEGNAAGCAACASMPADAQAQCLTVLSCN